MANNSIDENEVQTYIITPSMVSIEKVFKPNEIHKKRKGTVQSRIKVTNIGRFNISKLEITDHLLLDWKIKNKNSLSFSIFIDEKEYGMQFKAVETSVDGEKVEVGIDFSKGVEVTDEDENKQIIYVLEPDWSLVMKYPMHPPKELESGLYTTKVEVEATSVPVPNYPEGILMGTFQENVLEVK